MTYTEHAQWERDVSAIGLRRLCYFVCVAKVGSINRAARTLGVAQSALSRQMQELETALGTRLLSRDERGSTLTPAGRSLYVHAERVLNCLAELRRDFGV